MCHHPPPLSTVSAAAAAEPVLAPGHLMRADCQLQVKHDAIVKQGTNRDKIVYSQLSNIKEKRGDAEKLQAPTADEEALTAERTRQAFEKVSARSTSRSLFGISSP